MREAALADFSDGENIISYSGALSGILGELAHHYKVFLSVCIVGILSILQSGMALLCVAVDVVVKL